MAGQRGRDEPVEQLVRAVRQHLPHTGEQVAAELGQPVARRGDQAEHPLLDALDELLQPVDLVGVPAQRICGLLVSSGGTTQGRRPFPAASPHGVRGPARPGAVLGQ
jgi:hypothetical protein